MMTLNNKNFLEAAHLDADYTRVFDEQNVNWEKKSEWNLLFLKNIQNHMNDLLHVRGHVFLNDVYDRLGFKRTSEGQVVGWLMGGEGAGYVDIGLSNFKKDEDSLITLTFNVDGVIYDKI